MDRRSRLFVALLSLPLATSSFAQDTSLVGSGELEWSRKISAKSTAPGLGRCPWQHCFRVMVELSPRDGGTYGLAMPTAVNDSVAFSSGGSRCEGAEPAGLKNRAWDSLRRKWDMRNVTYASAAKPAMLILDYKCDSALRQGEEVTFQTAILIYENATSAGSARYVFKKIKLQ